MAGISPGVCAAPARAMAEPGDVTGNASAGLPLGSAARSVSSTRAPSSAPKSSSPAGRAQPPPGEEASGSGVPGELLHRPLASASGRSTSSLACGTPQKSPSAKSSAGASPGSRSAKGQRMSQANLGSLLEGAHFHALGSSPVVKEEVAEHPLSSSSAVAAAAPPAPVAQVAPPPQSGCSNDGPALEARTRVGLRAEGDGGD